MLNNVKEAFRKTIIISFGFGLLVGYINLLSMCIKYNNDIAITGLLMFLIFVICLGIEIFDKRERR